MLTVVTGPMYSGKTEELLRRTRRAQYAKKRTLCFKPVIDDRYGDEHIVSHIGSSARAEPVHSFLEIGDRLFSEVMSEDSVKVIIDEIQFLPDVVDHLDLLSEYGRHHDVVVCGLDMDFRGKPFVPTAMVMAIAHQVLKMTSICTKCGNDAHYSQRIVDGQPVTQGNSIEVGGVEMYEARCGKCFVNE